MIVISNLEKKIGIFVIKITNLTFKDNKIYLIKGRNGSGKSTLFKIIAGILDSDKGYIKQDKKSISIFLGITNMPDFLTPKEYFLIVGKSYNLKKDKIIKNYDFINSFFNKDYWTENKRIYEYSDGNKQLIGLIAAALSLSSTIILDEPFNYLDKQTEKNFINMILALHRKNKCTIVYSDNNEKLISPEVEVINIEK